MNKRLQVLKSVLLDALSAMLAWVTFFLYRKHLTENIDTGLFSVVFNDRNLYIGLLMVTLFWLMLYAIAGTYLDIYRKSRLRELGLTLLLTFLGTIAIFFVLILDDQVKSYIHYYKAYLVLFCLHFFFTALFRFILQTRIAWQIQHRKIGFNTLLIGSNGSAAAIFKEMEGQKHTAGNRFIGFVHVKEYVKHPMTAFLPHLGSFENVKQVIREHQVEEVIIAIDRAEHKFIEGIITVLEETPVVIKIIPDMQDILIGSVKMSAIWHAPLIRISPELMPPWQRSVKRMIDISSSIIAMAILMPAYIIVAIGVKLGSKGPIFYSHERIGLHGKPFKMFKFRSMYLDAEKDGPQLSSENDSRITRFGLFLRKVRLDETPQFYHVLIGEMSLVGPRPERQFFIDQIVARAPHYKMLHKVKPGITSWGQVKYGYAENVNEMVDRLKFDILYIENMNLAMDLKILIYTAIIILQGRGK
jgi:exopolysaccharide biosynthesis polyprenyl glycosylphosphotransferase